MRAYAFCCPVCERPIARRAIKQSKGGYRLHKGCVNDHHCDICKKACIYDPIMGKWSCPDPMCFHNDISYIGAPCIRGRSYGGSLFPYRDVARYEKVTGHKKYVSFLTAPHGYKSPELGKGKR